MDWNQIWVEIGKILVAGGGGAVATYALINWVVEMKARLVCKSL